MQFAAGAGAVEQKNAAAIGEALGKVGEDVCRYFADAALRLGDARNGDELAVYSRISRA